MQNGCNQQFTCDVFGDFLLKHRKKLKPFYFSMDFCESVSKSFSFEMFQNNVTASVCEWIAALCQTQKKNHGLFFQ